MRYVILIVLLAVFVTWDITRNDARHVDKAGRFALRMVHKVF